MHSIYLASEPFWRCFLLVGIISAYSLYRVVAPTLHFPLSRKGAVSVSAPTACLPEREQAENLPGYANQIPDPAYVLGEAAPNRA